MKTEKKKKHYDLNTEVKELSNLDEPGFKILVETMSGFKYTIKIKIDPSLLDQELVKLIDKDEDIVFILLIKYNHPYLAPFLFCLTRFSVPELSDSRDLLEDVLKSPWPIKKKKLLKKVIKLIPGFINDYLKNVTAEKNMKILGKYYLDNTYELNILKLFPYLYLDDIFEIVPVGNDKRVFDDKRKIMITEGFILLFVEKSVFEIQKLKLIFWGPIGSLSVIKQIQGKNIIELKWKAKKERTNLMRLKTEKSQQIFDILIDCLNKKKLEFNITNESYGSKKGELPKIDIVGVEQEISKLEIKIKINRKEGSNMENTVQLMNLYEKAVQYYSAINDYRFQIYMRKTKKLFNNMSDKDLGFKKLEEKKDKKDEKKKKGKKGKKKKSKNKEEIKEEKKEEIKDEKKKDEIKEDKKEENNKNKEQEQTQEKQKEENDIKNEVIKEDTKNIKKEDKEEKKEIKEEKKEIKEEKKEIKVEDKKQEKEKEEIKEEKKEIKNKVTENKDDKIKETKDEKQEEKKEITEIKEEKKVDKKEVKSESKQKFEKAGFNLDLDEDDE